MALCQALKKLLTSSASYACLDTLTKTSTGLGSCKEDDIFSREPSRR